MTRTAWSSTNDCDSMNGSALCFIFYTIQCVSLKNKIHHKMQRKKIRNMQRKNCFSCTSISILNLFTTIICTMKTCSFIIPHPSLFLWEVDETHFQVDRLFQLHSEYKDKKKYRWLCKMAVLIIYWFYLYSNQILKCWMIMMGKEKEREIACMPRLAPASSFILSFLLLSRSRNSICNHF